MTLLTLVWRNLRRYPRRSVLTIAGLAICVASFVLLSGVADGLQQSYLELYGRNGVDLIVQRSGASDRIGNTISEDLANDIRLLPGVRGITSGLFDIISLEDAGLPAVFINGWSADSPYFDGLEFLTGGKFRSGETRQAILGRTIATALGKSVGDRVQLYDESFQIVGVFESHSVFENGFIVVPLSDLQVLLGRQGQVTGFMVTLRDPLDSAVRQRVQRAIQELDRGLEAMPTREYIGTLDPIRLSRGLALVVSLVSILLGAAGMANACAMMAFERAREFGILRAIGWRKRRIAGLILSESVVLSLTAAWVGIGLAAVVLFGLTRLPAVASLLRMELSAAAMCQGVLLAFLIGCLGSVYPAWWAASLTPSVALHRE